MARQPTGMAGNVLSSPVFSVGDYAMLIEGAVPKASAPHVAAVTVPRVAATGSEGLPPTSSECVIFLKCDLFVQARVVLHSFSAHF